MSRQARMATGDARVPEAGVSSGGAADAGAGPFVINLTSSTTPMALSHPDSPELKRFSFFVSRRREDNRERFRLHMGYFATLAEAEEWLNVIRDLYPGAWAGEAPGKKLRANAAAAEMARQPSAPPPAPPAPAPARVSTPASAPNIEVPTLQAAPTLAAAPFVAPSAAPMLEAVAQAAAALAAVAKTAMAQSTVSGANAFAPPALHQSSALAAPAVLAAPAALAVPGVPAAHAGAPAAARTVEPAPAEHTVVAPNPFVSAPMNQAAPMVPAFAPAPPAPVVAAQPPRAPARAAAPVSASTPSAPKAGAQPAKAAAAPAQAPAPAKGAKKHPGNALTDGSNVREVMAALDDGGETRQMPIPPGLGAPASRGGSSAPGSRTAAAAGATHSAAGTHPAAAATHPAAATHSAAAAHTTSAAQSTSGARAASGSAARGSSTPAQAASSHSSAVGQGATQNASQAARTSASFASEKPRASAPPPAPRVVAEPSRGDTMSDTQVLRMLETRRSDDGDKGSEDANAGISLLKPDDTQTRRALKEAVLDNAPVAFAVQLQWSVQPVQLDKVPPLAIFSAYTLYTVEGSREGRKWYGLRLGFFSDAISAKQVAYYVRSEFTSVAVVPVSPGEKARATDEVSKAATGAFQRRHVEQKIEEFKLFDDDKLPSEPPPAPKAAEPPKAPAGRAPARKSKPGGRVKAREQRSPQTLEETLEILGASDLEIDNGRGELLNDTGVRHLRVEVQKNTPFAKLLDRISERVRKN